MESHESPRPDEAAAALDLVATSQAGLADRLITPRWYHPALGLMLGGLVVAYAVDSTLVIVVALVLFCVGTGILAASYRQLTGLTVNGYRSGAASRWAYALAAVFVVAVCGAVVLRNVADSLLPAVALGIGVAGATVLLGCRFDAALRAQLRG